MKIKLAVGLIAAIGLSAISAKAQDVSYEYPTVFNFTLTGLMPATNSPIESTKNTSTKSVTTTKYVAIKVKITNKEILALLKTEADTTGSWSGAKLVGFSNGDTGGDIYVADKTGTNILYYPEFTFDGSDSVRVGTDTDTYSETDTKSTDSWTGSGTETMIGNIVFSSSENYFYVAGLVVNTGSYSGSYVSITDGAATDVEKGKESFKANCAGTGYIAPGGGDGIISGTVTGTKSYSYKDTYSYSDSY